MKKEEPAEGEVQRLGEGQVFTCLGERDDLRLRGFGCGCGHLVAPGGIGVDGIDPAVAAHDASKRDGHIAAARSDIRAHPAFPQAQAIQSSRERAPVDVVAKFQVEHSGDDTHSRARCASARPRARAPISLCRR